MPASRDDDHATDGTTRRGPPQHPASGCDEIRLESGDLVIYDGRTGDAWIQSTVAVDIAALI